MPERCRAKGISMPLTWNSLCYLCGTRDRVLRGCCIRKTVGVLSCY